MATTSRSFWSRGGSLIRTAALSAGVAVSVWPCALVGPTAEVGVTHAVIEVVTAVPPADVLVDQSVIEVVTPRPPSTILVDHAIIEIVRPAVEIPPEENDDDNDAGAIGPILWLEWPVPDPPT
jgi:hypothetical protein